MYPPIARSTLFWSIAFMCISSLFYIFAGIDFSNVKENPEECIIDSWDKIIGPPEKQFQRLAVGINSNIDVIVSGTELLNALHVSPGKGKDHATIDNVGQLQEAFSYYFSKGSAAERPFTDKTDYQRIIQVAETLSHVEHYIGGNAALMAKTATRLFPDLKIHFVGPVGPLLESLMPKTLEIPSACRIPADEVHLIMEYKAGDKWGDAEASVATRFITSYDVSNSKSLMLEPFFESMKSFNPDLIALSGLNLLDGQSSEFFKQRLEKVVMLSKQVPSSTPLHLELASMADIDLVQEIFEKVLPNVDSIGLNEQELIFASQASSGPHAQDIKYIDGQPAIHQISDMILWLLKSYGNSENNPTARLTRVHFHSLTYHITAVVLGSWSNVDAATGAGSRVAGLQACDVESLDKDLVELKIPKRFKLHSNDEERNFDPSNPVIDWQIDDFLFVFSPVLVCKSPVKTVGLGDAISATGLMHSSFNPPF